MTTVVQPTLDRAALLRRALQADAMVSGAASVAAIVAAAPVAAATGIPAALLQPLGAMFLAYAGVLAYASTRPTIKRTLAWGVVTLNSLWVIACVAVLGFGWVPLTGTGVWVVVTQAVLVDLFAGAQYLGLRRAR